ncbi:TolC family outer membrane protein [Piscinibacter sakaiensis]|uniref:TolC family outer membrane protein n=1 Tax=Piscinibacter sakaiensis TaxID=1547922 RepID=UPI003AAB24DF
MPVSRHLSQNPAAPAAGDDRWLSPEQTPQPAGKTRKGLRLMPLAAWLLGAGLFAGTSASQAQSLLELYQAAHAYDATYLAAKALAESAPYRAAQSKALKRPNAALGGSASMAQVDPPTRGGLTSNSLNLALSGRQSLYNRANDVTIEQAEKQLQQSVHELDSAEQDLIIRLAQAYFDVLAAQDTLATTGASKAAISEQLASAKRNFEVGTATITDTREAQARFDLATAQEIAADNDLKSKRVVLDQLVGRIGVVPKQLAIPVVLPPLVPAQMEAWVSRAEAEHPAVQRAQLALEVARLEVNKARAGRQPTLDAVASVSATHANGSAAAFNGNKGTTGNASVGLQFNLPLYTGGLVDNRIQETLVLEDKARNDLEAARRAVSQATRTAFLAVQSGEAQVKALEAAESSSLLAVEATLLGYKVGVRVNLDVLNAQTQLYTTRRDLAQARYNLLLSRLRLAQASGKLLANDVAAVDRLLKR